MPLLPAVLSSLLVSSPAVGISGSRAPGTALVAALQAVLAAIPPAVPVVVGCGRGIDARTRAARPSARVVWAAGRAPGLLAARSSQLARHVASVGGTLVAFPSGPCPGGLVPARASAACFSGHGSGTWGTAALAAGLGISVAVFLPPGVAAPPWLGPAVAPGWHLYAPRAVQGLLL